MKHLSFLFLFLTFFFDNTFAQQNALFTLNGDVFGTRVFVENKGQYNLVETNGAPVLYAYENGEEQIYFTARGLVYKQARNKPLSEKETEELIEGKKLKRREGRIYSITQSWKSANSV